MVCSCLCYERSLLQLAYSRTSRTSQDDIFPLGDNGHAYWSGYFTSRCATQTKQLPRGTDRATPDDCDRGVRVVSVRSPALKRQVRVASNFLNAARQLEVLSKVI